MASGQVSLRAAFPNAALTIGVAALVGLAVWQLCIKVPWPEKFSVRFYALHMVAAVIYGFLWMVGTIAVEPLLTHTQMWGVLKTSRAITWVLTGVWLYAAIAGISYAIQTQRRARENERRALRAEAGLSAARLDALQHRLHPHFLFNALHTVAALVREDSAQAENAIEKLGDMLRYTLQDDIGNTVPFAEEWGFTRRYLDFEQLRYGDRLTVETAIDPECMTCSAPLFAVQTLVENAVRHSIAMRPQGGKIEITARTDDQRLFVKVRDDGGNGLPAQDGSHFGLHALRERLNAVYGDGAHLTIASEPQSFEVSFVIPRSESEGADDE
jgi:two-component system LytT family sensor kinase